MSRTIFPPKAEPSPWRNSAEGGARHFVAGHCVAVVESRSGILSPWRKPPKAERRGRRKVHHHPRPIGRVEIYRETRTLSIWQIVAGKFRPKKKRRGQVILNIWSWNSRQSPIVFNLSMTATVLSYLKPCSLSSRPLSPSYNLTTFDLVSWTI